MTDSLAPSATSEAPPAQSNPPRDLPGPAASVKPRAAGDHDAHPSAPPSNPGPSVAPAKAKAHPASESLDRVLSIALTVHVELGRRKIRVGELLRMGVGQIVELDAAAGAPLSIYANNTLIAEGEAVVIGDRYGIRITDIVSPTERVERLGGGKGGS